MKKVFYTLISFLLLTAGCTHSPSPASASKFSAGSSAPSGCTDARSCEDLGVRYITGDGVRTDGHRAVRYLAQACNMGRGSACNGAAFIYADAEGGVTQDYRKALDYWSRACRLGDQTGCANYRLAQDKLKAMRSGK